MELSGTFSVTLFRDGRTTPWGFRLQGGADHNKPLHIQRVFPGSPAEGHLQRGDLVMRIANHDVSSMTHLEAHDMFKNAGNQISMTVHRAPHKAPVQTPLISHLAGGVSPGRHMASPKAGAHHVNQFLEHPADLLPAVHINETIEHHRHEESHYEMHQTSSTSTNVPINSGSLTLPRSAGQAAMRKLSDGGMTAATRRNMLEEWQKEQEKKAIHHQAYRTLPLITPGVKVKRDVPIGSYLRFQYDPKAGPPQFEEQYAEMLHPPSAAPETTAMSGHQQHQHQQQQHYHQQQQHQHPVASPNDYAMKQKVADAVTNVAATMKHSTIPITEEKKVVNKQFNSPINLYSKENVQKVVQEQTGLTPPGIQMPKHFDPSKSPTYLVLQEMEDTTREQRPVQSKVYTAPSAPPAAPHDHRNPMGADGKILQSYSFNKIMMDVLGESSL